MSLVVNTNVGSLNAQRSLASSGAELKTAMERLSSGKKINSAADDAAGFAIAERMTAQIRGLNAAVRNVNDAISFLQTTQSMYNDQTDIVQRIRELAVQAASDTNSVTDRQFLQGEVDELVLEMARIRHQTKFNGEDVGGWKSFQVGSEVNQTLELYVGTHTEYSGSVFGQLTQSVAAGETTLEIKGLTTSGPYAVGDVVIAGLSNPEGIFVSGVQDAILHEDGTFTQVLTLANGVATDLDAAFHIIAAVGSVDLETGEYTSGGRGSLKTIDLVNNAAGALRGIDSTLNVIADSRAQLGANLNRLEYTVSNLMNVSEFTAAARSRIEDADFAAESARLAKAQVLQQTGTAMLAQANAQPQLALSLIR